MSQGWYSSPVPHRIPSLGRGPLAAGPAPPRATISAQTARNGNDMFGRIIVRSVRLTWLSLTTVTCARTAAPRAFFPIPLSLRVMRSIAVEPALISDLSNASYLPEVTLGRWPRCSPIW